MQKAYLTHSAALTLNASYARIKKLRDWINVIYMATAFIFQFTIVFQLMVLAVIACHLMVLIFTDEKQLAYPQIIWTIVFVVYFLLHQLAGFAVIPSVALDRLITTAIYYIIINSFMCQLSASDRLNFFANGLTVIMIALSLYLLYKQAGTLGTGGTRFGTEIRMGDISLYYPVLGYVLYNPNWIGQPCAMCLIMQLYLHENDKKFARLPTMLLLIVLILLSGSRKSLILGIGGPFLYLFLKERNFSKKTKMVAIGIVLGIIVIILVLNVPILYTIIGGRMENYIMSLFGQADLIERSAIYRGQMVDDAMVLFQERPWVGYGIDSYRFLSSFNVYSHNNYTELMISGGILSLIVYYWFYLYIIIKTFLLKGDRKLRAMSLSIMLILPILEYGWVIYVDRSLCVPLAIGYHAIAVSKRQNLDKSTKPSL